MARQSRLALAGHAHHIIQRGNNRQTVFFDAADCERFLGLLGDIAATSRLAVHAYVLMPNHLHLLATPTEASDLSKAMQALGRRYALWVNRRHQRTGTLWEGRFRASVVESERYLLACARYIEMNPVRAGLVAEPSAYRWSSYAHHVGLRPDPLIDEHPLVWSLGNTPFERQSAYRRLFEHPGADQEAARIRAAIQGGWAVGDAAFVERIGSAVGRPASLRRPGRPAKVTQSVPD
ncbi:MAG: transposase [Burkholderiaceae bacterium]|jgi:putative transposase|nr:transposase [Burkholderiaceae bacterium]